MHRFRVEATLVDVTNEKVAALAKYHQLVGQASILEAMLREWDVGLENEEVIPSSTCECEQDCKCEAPVEA